MINIDDLPQSLRDNVVHVEFPEVPMGAGSAMLVAFANGLDASVVTGPFTYGGQNGLFELAVGFTDEGVWEDCPLTESGGITGWLTQEDLIALLARVGEFDSPELLARRQDAERQQQFALHVATQFGILRLAGLGENDDPFDYLNAEDLGLSLGLDPHAVDALRALNELYVTATEKLSFKHLEELVAKDEENKS